MRSALLLLAMCALVITACGRSATAAQQAGAGRTASPAAGTVPPPSPGASPAAAAASAPSPAASMGAEAPSPAGRPASAASAPTPVPAGTIVSSWNSPKYGQILVGASGHVLYLYTPDVTSTPTCTGSCAAAWPPLTTRSGAPRAEGQVQQSLLGVSDGQVTYNGHPLYFYAADPQADQTNGQGVAGVWYVVNVNGNANHTP